LPIISRRREKEITRQFIGKLDIKTTGPAQKVRFLSGGNQQKVVLSKWLCQRAQIFIFDEPTVGIDVGTKEEFYRLIRQLAEEGAGIVVISSDFKELETLCDRILVIREGQIAGELPANQITEDNILYLCYAGQKQSLSQS
jgi:ABC-type sugar transport system ATPase subunit